MWKSFLESDHLSVLPWARQFGYTTVEDPKKVIRQVEKITKGWADKKRAFLEKAIVKFEAEFQTTMEKNWKAALKNASQAEAKIINDFSRDIGNGIIPEGTKALERVFKMFRLVLGKSTNNNQNTNANFNVPLSAEETKEIADVINQNNAFYKRPGLETIEQEGDED